MCGVLLAAANLALGQLNQGTARTWTGGGADYKLGSSANWNPSGAPASGSGDIAIWDTGGLTGNVAGNVLQVTNAAGNSSNPGMTLQVTGNHTNGLTIVSTGGSNLRLGTNSLVIASGSGPVSLGNGGPNQFPVALALGGGNANYFTNNSAYPATINSDVNFTMGGGNLHYVTLCGSGSWNLYNNWAPINNSGGSQDQMIINCAGMVTYAPTNEAGITYAAPFSGITLNSGTFKLGNAWCLTNLAGALTLNGGTFDINGFSITNNLSGAANIDSSSGSATLTVSNGTSTTFSGIIKNTSGTLSLSKLGAGTLTLSGADTYSGATTINAGAIVVNGAIGSGGVTVASSASLGGSGTIGGNVNWQSGSSALFAVTNSSGANTLYLKVSGSLALNNNSVSINVPGSTPLPVGSYTLVNASGGSSGQFVTTITSANYTGAGVAPGTISSIATSGGVATLTVSHAGVTTTWTNDLAGGTANWSGAANWLNNYVPASAGDVAVLGVGSAVSTVTLDINASVGGITFTNPNSFLIAGTGKTLTWDNKGGGAAIIVSGGTSNAIATAVSLNDNAAISIGSADILSISGHIGNTSASEILTKTGNGNLILAAANTYGPAAGSIGTVLGGGTLELTNSLALGTGDLTNSASSTIALDLPMTLANRIWTSAANTVTLNDKGNAVNLTGGLGGGGSLTKSGAGWDIITNNGASSIGTLAVNSGVLEIAAHTTIAASGQLFVDNGSTLQVDAGATLNYNASAYGFIGNTTGTVTTNIIYGTLNYSNANFVVARDGGGNMTINSGRFLCNNFFDGQASASDSGYVYLNGGSLVVNNVQSGGGVNYFYFNGGALVAKVASTTFWADNTALFAYVESNPGTIDNGGNAITIAQPINSETGTDGGMIFQGTNVTTLAGANGYNGPTTVNAGTLLVNGSTSSGNVTVASGATLGGTGNVGGNVEWQAGSVATISLTNNGTDNGTPLNISGVVTLDAATPISINVLGATPLPVGTYTLMNSAGITGSFAVTPIITGAGISGGTVATVSINGGTAYLTVLVGGNTWINNGNGNWSAAADWSGNPIIPRLPGDTALLGVGAAFTAITLDTNISLGSLSFTNDNSFLIANAGKTMTFATTSGNLAINVAGGQSNEITAPVVLNGLVTVSETLGSGLEISNSISGSGGFSVGGDGTGILTLGGSNTYSGGTTITGGTLVLGSTNALGTNTVTLSGCNLDSAVTNLVNANNNPQIWAGNIGFAGSENLNLGAGSVVLSNSMTLSVTNELTVGGPVNGGALTLTLNGTGTLELDGNNSFGTVSTSLPLLLFGSDTAAGTSATVLNCALPGAAFASSSSATRNIHDVLGANGGNGWTFSGTGNLIFDGGVTSYNFGKGVTVNNPVTTWNFALPNGAGATTKYGAGTLVFGGANLNTGGTIVTAGTLALANGGALGTGPLTMNGGNLDSLAANLLNTNNNAQTWNTSFAFLGSQSLNLGTGSVTMNNNTTITVSNNTLTVGGAIADGGSGYSLTLAGSGTLVLDGANTYIGATVVSSGTLAGGGTVAGALTNNATLAPGDSGNGSLTVSGNLTLNAGSTNVFAANGTTSANASVVAGGNVNYGGVLLISPAGTFTAGQQFQLFSGTGATNASNFASLQGSPGSGLGFAFTNGVLSVVTAGPSGPARITSSSSGSMLSLAWPAGQGWRLQMQTNSLATGLGTNWSYVSDGSISSTNITVDPNRPTVFYRLIYP